MELAMDEGLVDQLDESVDECMRLIASASEYESYPNEKVKQQMESFLSTVKLLERQFVNIQTACASLEAVAAATEVEELKVEIERKDQLILQSKTTLMEWERKFGHSLASSAVFKEFRGDGSNGSGSGGL